MTTALSVRGLTTGYGAGNVLDGLNVSIAAGECVGILGPNGAGKTTLLRAIAGHISAAGQVVVFEVPVQGRSVERRARDGIGLVPEGRSLFLSLTVHDNLRAGTFTGRDGMPLDDVYTLFPRLGERRTSLARQLSGGEQQMLAIGRALVGGPRVLLIDEPSLGLAPMVVEAMFANLRDLVKQGITVCLGEQNVRAALAVTDRCLLLDQGRVVLDQATRSPEGREAVLQAYTQIVAISL